MHVLGRGDAMTTQRSTILIGLALAVASVAGAAPPKIDPKAISALKEMGAYLQKQESFTVKTESETDYVLDNGQKVKMSARGDLRVQRPNRLRANVTSDRKDREFFYDGKTFTMYGPQVGLYTSVPAPPTIGELADVLTAKYGLQLPLVDLFRWGSTNYDTRDITAASYVGPAKVAGVETDHFAFRQKGVDWQVWIERGQHRVPRKIVLTTTDDKTRPEYEVELTWNLGVTHDAAEFAFTPPKDSLKIPLQEIGNLPVETARSARRRQPK
jgi:hypothetical protein